MPVLAQTAGEIVTPNNSQSGTKASGRSALRFVRFTL